MSYRDDDECIKKAYSDEKLFVLMERDAEAPRTIIHWISRSLGKQPREKLTEALDTAIDMYENGEEFRKRRADEKEKAHIEKMNHDDDLYNRGLKDGQRMATRDRVVPTPMRDDVLKAQTTRLTDMPFDGKAEADKFHKGMQEAEKRADVVGFARNFANWLDAQGHNSDAYRAYLEPHGNLNALERFINSLPARAE